MGCRIGIIVYCIVQCIAFLLILVGTPIDQFRAKNEDIFGNTACLTFWGRKAKCYSTTYDVRTNTLFAGCSDRKNRFNAAAGFSIISLAIFLLGAIFGFIQLCCCRCLRWLCLVLNILGVAAACIPWACMVSEYYNNRSITDVSPYIAFCIKMEEFHKYGAGFALFVTGWCLCIVNIVFLMLPF